MVEEKKVIFDVTVLDNYGRVVSGLTADNFKLNDEKESKPITFFSAGSEAASIAVLVDVSASMPLPNLSAVAQELPGFINKANPKNEYSIFTFSGSFQSLNSLTNDREAIMSGLRQLTAKKPQDGTKTKLFDAVKLGLESLDAGKNRKKALIVISDATDNSSKIKFEQIKWLVRESNVLLYNLQVDSPRLTSSGFADERRLLEELTRISGGAVFKYETSESLSEGLVRIALNLQYQYVIGFLPSPSKAKDKDKDEWRKVKIKVEYPANEKVKRDMTVIAREGYYATR